MLIIAKYLVAKVSDKYVILDYIKNNSLTFHFRNGGQDLQFQLSYNHHRDTVSLKSSSILSLTEGKKLRKEK